MSFNIYDIFDSPPPGMSKFFVWFWRIMIGTAIALCLLVKLPFIFLGWVWEKIYFEWAVFCKIFGHNYYYNCCTRCLDSLHGSIRAEARIKMKMIKDDMKDSLFKY